MNARRLCLILAAIASTAGAQGKTHTVRGTILDGATKTGLAGALVQIQNASNNASSRSDDDGAVRLSLPAGAYQLVVRRIGYDAVQKQIMLPDSSSEFTISLQQQPQKLPPVRVLPKGAGIYGVVISGTLNRAMPYARVQVAGTGQTMMTDSAGSFFFDVTPGRYMVRIGRAGYATEMFPIDVPKDQVVDASTILDKSRGEDGSGYDGLFQDLDERLKWSGQDATLLTGSELRHAGTNVLDAVMASPAFIKQGMRIDPLGVCVYVNGMARPGVAIDNFVVDEIESIEVYGRAASAKSLTYSGNDAAEMLKKSWPGDPDKCPIVSRALPATLGGYTGRSIAHWVVIWTKR